MQDVRLTEYSHGAGCGCKISPAMLEAILQSAIPGVEDAALLVGNDFRDDAAVYDVGAGMAVISTTDFFMPIVDDPFTFGRIAATNAMSDIYAMGGRPIMAIAIFGWPIDKLAVEVGRAVVEGGRKAARDAGINIAGGHSIDSPEPIFGLAVTGLVDHRHLKRNNCARPGDVIYLTKPLGIGILTTAQKQKKLRSEHAGLAPVVMCTLNDAGADFGAIEAVSAMTDVTGFGLLGHLLEVCEGSNVRARIEFDKVPLLPRLDEYLALGCVPGGTHRNFESYGHKVEPITEHQRLVLCDPQTSGGLLVFVSPQGEQELLAAAARRGVEMVALGEVTDPGGDYVVNVA